MNKLISVFRENSKKENMFVLPIIILFYILCFFIPSFSALPIFNYITIVIVILLCLLILAWRLVFHKIVLNYFFFGIVIFNIAIFVSNLFNKDANHIITYVTLSGMSFCLFQFFLEKKYRNIVRFLVFLSFATFAIYFAFYYRSLLFDFSVERIGDKFDNLNTVGYYFLFSFVTSLAFINRNNKLSLLLLVPAGVFLFFLYRTGSRSALILAFLSIIIYVFYFFKGLKIIIPIVVVLCIFGLGIVIAVIAEKAFDISIFSRLGEFFDALNGEGTDYSSANRIELAIQSFLLFLRKPIFGWGNNVFSIYSSERLFAHNNITELLCDYGLFGFLPFECILIFSYYSIKKSKAKNQLVDYSILLLICVFGIQFFYVNSQLKFDWIAIAFFASEATLCSKEIVKTSKPRIFEYIEMTI